MVTYRTTTIATPNIIIRDIPVSIIYHIRYYLCLLGGRIMRCIPSICLSVCPSVPSYASDFLDQGKL